MENFTPVSALIGGVLIGLSAVLLMALNGRVAGISGILANTVIGAPGDRLWRLLFIAGLIAGPLVVRAVSGEPLPFEITTNLSLLISGGLLVGIGTRLGSGCTSGHGVCGLSRFSVRSLVAVITFMGVGMLTVALIRALVGG
ncbi:YeeE/YedE family protein [Hyphobacterium sp.]|uniref:YeeE/YedE family protein n=1 Tax=Hyphobacterium sp. TaxID=2004662 RepID=UPI003BABB436